MKYEYKRIFTGLVVAYFKIYYTVIHMERPRKGT